MISECGVKEKGGRDVPFLERIKVVEDIGKDKVE